ncbi:phosphoglycerate mutase-like protein 1 isoform X2 [Trifolium pratense]|uniref:phosphoglycerate mutase-like protein 1 isoform X2 n=1 Tax=Trifolium pratense TaxID=57577 RepID=UPI001E6939FB|nr:phosphoglycerate mutase-like protein 1 isoform X2 [Trifolium pratense]
MPLLLLLKNSSFILTTLISFHNLRHHRASQRSPRSTPTDMDTSSGQGIIYPLHRCKKLHLVRHAQGFHNVEGDKNPDSYVSYDLFDASLTPLGWKQVDNLREHVKASGLSKRVQLVVVSPLSRTMQTAVGVFGGDAHADGIDAPPLMNDNVGNSNRHAISSLNSPPFIAVELCREHLGVHPCDKRRSITEYQNMFPAIDFSLSMMRTFCGNLILERRMKKLLPGD